MWLNVGPELGQAIGPCVPPAVVETLRGGKGRRREGGKRRGGGGRGGGGGDGLLGASWGTIVTSWVLPGGLLEASWGHPWASSDPLGDLGSPWPLWGSGGLPRSPQDGPRWPLDCPGGRQDGPTGPKTGPRVPKTRPRRSQEAPRGPKRLQSGPRGGRTETNANFEIRYPAACGKSLHRAS